MSQLILHPDKERSLFRRHPWIFATSVAHFVGRARPGDTVEVVSDNGKLLGKAAWSPVSQIRARMWSFDANETIDDAFFKRRVAVAVSRRIALPELHSQQGLRLIHAESDGLPGVIADRYGDTIVLALTSAGAEKWRDAIVGALKKATGCTRIYERSDSEVRKLEGLEPRKGWIPDKGEDEARGEMADATGSATSDTTKFAIEENGVKLLVDIAGGHKTGFYLDQRDNRLLLRNLANGKRVLNCFCYTGGFSLQALAGGASEVISIDSSGPALDIARENLTHNPQLDAAKAEWRDADVFTELRKLRETREQFDIIVLDPPKFAPSASHADRAARAYKDINLLGFRLLAPGGLLMTYSCSGGIGLELFQKIVAGAALDSGRSARIIKRLQGSADHPVALEFPEGEYLKGLLVQVD
jgi:23S rRNA (cytosine1962-C5)-methyltransferase